MKYEGMQPEHRVWYGMVSRERESVPTALTATVCGSIFT